MRRRRLLTLSAIGLASLAGCASSEEPGGEDTPAPTRTETPTRTPTDTPTQTQTESGEPSFEVEIDAPAEVEIGESYTVEFIVRNTGTAAGTYESAVYNRFAGEDYAELDTISAEIDPGEEVVWDIADISINLITTEYFYVENGDVEAEVNAVSRKLEFGDGYTTLDDIVLFVFRLEFQDSYTWNSGDREYEEPAPDGEKWAFLSVEVVNESGGPARIPLARDFSLIANSRQYDDEYVRKSGQYEGGEVQAGIRRTGWIAYSVPSELTKDEIRAVWSEEYSDGQAVVYWEP
jgi:hypothetical protein